MNLISTVAILFCVVLLLPMATEATELVDSLDKTFKTAGYPESEVVVRMAIRTLITEEHGERLEDTYLQSMKVHRKLHSMMEKNGWGQEDPLLIDVIDAGDIQLVTGRGMNLRFKETLRLKAYLSSCDGTMVKYRGGSIDKFLQKTVIEKAEDCFTYEERLQGRNYPY